MDQSEETMPLTQGPLQGVHVDDDTTSTSTTSDHVARTREALHDLRQQGVQQREQYQQELQELHRKHHSSVTHFRKRWATLDEQTRPNYTRALKEVLGLANVPPQYVLRSQVDLMHASHQKEVVLEHQIELLELQDAELVAMLQTELRQLSKESKAKEKQHLATLSRVANRNRQIYELQERVCCLQEELISVLNKEGSDSPEEIPEAKDRWWKKGDEEDVPTVESSGHSRSSSESLSDELTSVDKEKDEISKPFASLAKLED